MGRRSNSSVSNSMPPRSTIPHLARISGIHVAQHAKAKQRTVSAAFAWISRLEPLEAVFLTHFNTDVESGKPPIANTVQVKFTLKNRHPVPEPAEHWLHWLELRERVPRRDWSKAERLLRALALEVAEVIASGKLLVPSKLRREIAL